MPANDIDAAVRAVIAGAENLVSDPNLFWLQEDARNDNLA
ncbi:hypothetical protein QFZ79_002883 [Arthrobacter sp. V4I6]|nr:hypothetical protein [Arthrobacter sp. V4I6]